jgi:hypothetical protein
VLPSVPDPAEPVVRDFCDRLCPGMIPVRLPLVRLSHARPLDCFESVRRHRRANGGDPAHGWQIWQWDGLFLEAEFHAVWRAPDGRLVDITPKRAPVKESLFVPDAVRTFTGTRVDNVRMALTPDPRVADFIATCAEEWQLLYAGPRGRQRNPVLSGAERLALDVIRKRQQAAAEALGMVGARLAAE